MSAELKQTEEGWQVCGDISYKTVVAIREAGERCLEQARSGCCFDFSGVEQVNTAALTLALCWHRKATRLGIDLSYVNVPPALLAIARMSDLSSLFEPSA